MANSAIIVAAGEGRRFGEAKQFYLFRKRALFLYALDAFEVNKNINTIIIVVPKERIVDIKVLIKKNNYKKVQAIVVGGKRRQDSVLNGLKAIRNSSGIVVIHDGVRPVVSQTIIEKGITLCRKYKAVICGIPIFETVKKINRGVVLQTVLRRNLYLIQTPQFFKHSLIENAYRRANLAIEYTDEAALLESLGIPVRCFLGDRYNIKITKKSDLKVLNCILP